MSQSTPPATGKQLAYLRALASQTGTTFATPRSRGDASREIDRLRRFKRQHGQHIQTPGAGREPEYATAPHPSEIDGWGSTAHWRTTRLREPTSPASRSSKAPSDDGDSGSPDPDSTAIATYRHEDTGLPRELVVVPLSSGALLIDQAPGHHGDRRLVGRIDADEPAENTQILARLYLQDPSRGRCRRLLPGDLDPNPDGVPADEPNTVRWDAPLVAGIGATFRIEVLDTDSGAVLRWTRTVVGQAEQSVAVSLRHVVGQLQGYQPAMAMTTSAISAHKQRPGCSTAAIRGELARLQASPIVLNCRLRERVERAVRSEGLTMSEIAIRCGRVKRDQRGNVSGETSWLARRIGQLPDAGQSTPTPWISSDVLALIARDGLGVSPREVELS